MYRIAHVFVCKYVWMEAHQVCHMHAHQTQLSPEANYNEHNRSWAYFSHTINVCMYARVFVHATCKSTMQNCEQSHFQIGCNNYPIALSINALHCTLPHPPVNFLLLLPFLIVVLQYYTALILTWDAVLRVAKPN